MDPRLAELPRDLKLEAEQEASIELLCPYGCGVGRVDDQGRCRHLVGYVMKGTRTVELRERVGDRQRCGVLIRDLQKDDVIIPTMKRTRRNTRKQHTPSPTYRVYRKDGRAPMTPSDKMQEIVGYRQRPETSQVGWGDEAEFDDLDDAITEDTEADMVA